jgi:hypothetical protein
VAETARIHERRLDQKQAILLGELETLEPSKFRNAHAVVVSSSSYLHRSVWFLWNSMACKAVKHHNSNGFLVVLSHWALDPFFLKAMFASNSICDGCAAGLHRARRCCGSELGVFLMPHSMGSQGATKSFPTT